MSRLSADFYFKNFSDQKEKRGRSQLYIKQYGIMSS